MLKQFAPTAKFMGAIRVAGRRLGYLAKTDAIKSFHYSFQYSPHTMLFSRIFAIHGLI